MLYYLYKHKQEGESAFCRTETVFPLPNRYIVNPIMDTIMHLRRQPENESAVSRNRTSRQQASPDRSAAV